ncbi:MAG TPA: Rieske 2Fe-2S domain-containing protein [Nitrospiria bacterium]|nr:Rieske 2Fe-2S domain-containing protein [Nitrospiria bacterium]
MLIEAASVDDIAPGGMKAVEVKGEEIVLGNHDGTIFAVSRRCGHMNAPLELGSLHGYILTCPMHHAQFDITSGEALSGPVPANLGNEPVPPGIGKFLQYIGMLMSHITTCNLKRYPVTVENGVITVEV